MKQIFNILYTVIFLVIFIFNSPINTRAVPGDAPIFQDNFDVDSFTKELESLFSNMSEEDKNIISKLKEELDADMISKGLDPNNPEDQLKYTFGEMGMGSLEPQAEPKEDLKSKILAPAKIGSDQSKTKDSPKANLEAPVKIKKDISKEINILDQLLKHLKSFRQKASFNAEYIKIAASNLKLLEDLIYFVSLLREPSLLEHLVSDQFKNLFNNIKNLNLLFAEKEPQIEDFEIFETPYDILFVNQNASQSDIEQAYKDLNLKYGPDSVSNKYQDTTSKEYKKALKQAQIDFGFIKNAYEALTKENRQKTDKEIETKKRELDKLSTSSKSIFNKLNSELTVKANSIVTDIKSLLEKHKPIELEKAKKRDALEAELLQQSIKNRNQPISGGSTGYLPSASNTSEPYAEFYNTITEEMRKKEFDQKYGSFGSLGQNRLFSDSATDKSGSSSSSSSLKDSSNQESGKASKAEEKSEKTETKDKKEAKETKDKLKPDTNNEEYKNKIQNATKILEKLDTDFSSALKKEYNIGFNFEISLPKFGDE